MYDAIVVGARCGGAPAAMQLAREGLRVLLVDKAAFPSDTLSTLIIHNPGVRQLEAWGLLDQVMATGCPAIRTWSLDIGGHTLAGRPPDGRLIITIAPRRTLLDPILIKAAVMAGAEFREKFVVDGFLTEGGRITGVRGRTSSGRPVAERSTIVIGADGKHSRLARTVGAAQYNAHPPQAFYYYTFWSGLPVNGIEAAWRPGRFLLAIPTHGGLTCLVVGQPADRFKQFRQSIASNYFRSVEKTSPRMARLLHDANRTDRFFGTADLPNFYRKPFGPGWALVGDAGLYMDPLGGYGIMYAFRDSRLLAEAIMQGFDGKVSMQQALAGYENRRNEASVIAFEQNWKGARFQNWDRPPRPQLFALLRDDEAERTAFFGMYAHMTAPHAFYARTRIAELIRRLENDGAPQKITV